MALQVRSMLARNGNMAARGWEEASVLGIHSRDCYEKTEGQDPKVFSR